MPLTDQKPVLLQSLLPATDLLSKCLTAYVSLLDFWILWCRFVSYLEIWTASELSPTSMVSEVEFAPPPQRAKVFAPFLSPSVGNTTHWCVAFRMPLPPSTGSHGISREP